MASQTNEPKTREIREAVGVFDRAADFQAAIDELLSSGFDRAELSLLAGEKAVKDKLGETYKRSEDMEDKSRAPRTEYVSEEAVGDAEGGLIGGLAYLGATVASGVVIATGGTIGIAIAAAVLTGGTGGLIGSMLARLIGERHAQHMEQQLTRGGLLLWVRTRNAERERQALAILRKHAGYDVHVHALHAVA